MTNTGMTLNIYSEMIEYQVPSIDLFTDISNRTYKTYKALNNDNIISPDERRIFLAYLFYGSYRKTAKHTGIMKYRQIGNIVVQVRNKIKNYVENK